MYGKIVKEFINNPRDIHTIPIHSKTYRWFYVFVNDGNIYVEPGHNNSPKCTVKKRLLPKKECNEILRIYHRRMHGEQVSKEAQNCTHSQVYWYGIFSAMNL